MTPKRRKRKPTALDALKRRIQAERSREAIPRMPPEMADKLRAHAAKLDAEADAIEASL